VPEPGPSTYASYIVEETGTKHIILIELHRSGINSALDEEKAQQLPVRRRRRPRGRRAAHRLGGGWGLEPTAAAARRGLRGRSRRGGWGGPGARAGRGPWRLRAPFRSASFVGGLVGGEDPAQGDSTRRRQEEARNFSPTGPCQRYRRPSDMA
jgi:hypothetical protein